MNDHYDLSEIAAFLRYQQLMQNVLHPDDCRNWSADGTDPHMKELAGVLAEQGILDLVDARARRLMAQVQFARTTTREIQKSEGPWGEALAALHNWTDVAIAKQQEATIGSTHRTTAVAMQGIFMGLVVGSALADHTSGKKRPWS